MNRDNQPWRATPAAELDDPGHSQPVPHSTAFEDVYYSVDSGIEEGRHVFLKGNGLPGRWRDGAGRHFCIAETGFGTGLNFLLTWQAWRALPEPRPRVHYLSVEKFPLSREQLRSALCGWIELSGLVDNLLSVYPPRIPGQHRRLLEDGQICLDLWWEDVGDALPDLASHGQGFVDAWYLDGFAPARNPDMWRPELFAAMAAASRPGATFATFTAAGQVRRDLQRAGFEVEKVPGFGRKRECLRGRLQAAPGPVAPASTPWDLPREPEPVPDHAIVVGAGLAGCTVARALASRGIRVDLLERGALAAAGSGNEQGILYTRLSRKHSPLADFALLSFCFAAARYRDLFECGALREGVDGALCGSFHQAGDTADMAYLSRALVSLEELAQVMDCREAYDLLGVAQPSAGYWFPASGWLNPAAVCRTMVARENISLQENLGAIELDWSDGSWRASAGGQTVAEASCAVIATGTAAGTQRELAWLPLQSIRGQTTLLPALPELAALRSALCHEGYIAPAREGQHCIGATFDLGDDCRALRPEDQQRNLQALARAVPAWRDTLETLDPGLLGGRVGFRCASPDYLPVVGPVPARDDFLQCFADLRKNARQIIPQRAPCMPGLHVSTCHGSRGLTSTPLAAELLASQICGEAPPLARDLSRALSPARFLARGLSRNRL